MTKLTKLTFSVAFPAAKDNTLATLAKIKFRAIKLGSAASTTLFVDSRNKFFMFKSVSDYNLVTSEEMIKTVPPLEEGLSNSLSGKPALLLVVIPTIVLPNIVTRQFCKSPVQSFWECSTLVCHCAGLSFFIQRSCSLKYNAFCLSLNTKFKHLPVKLCQRMKNILTFVVSTRTIPIVTLPIIFGLISNHYGVNW